MNAPKVMPTLPDAQTVIGVQHYTDRLFSFKVSRPKTLRFRSGEFVMIGLLKEDGICVVILPQTFLDSHHNNY